MGKRYWTLVRPMSMPDRCPLGRRPGAWNPRYCSNCFVLMEAQHGGAEIPCSLLFADVRRSMALAEQISPAELHRLMERFYEMAARVLFAHDAILDKFVGERRAQCRPSGRGRSSTPGGDRPRRAGRTLAAAPRVGIHTGVAFVGAVGKVRSTTVTALGDVVNVAIRLASSAGPGELLVTDTAAAAAGLAGDRERRHLGLKGKRARRSRSSCWASAPGRGRTGEAPRAARDGVAGLSW